MPPPSPTSLILDLDPRALNRFWRTQVAATAAAAVVQKLRPSHTDRAMSMTTVREAGLQNVVQVLSRLMLHTGDGVVDVQKMQAARELHIMLSTADRLQGLKASVEEVSAALTDGDEALIIKDVIGKV